MKLLQITEPCEVCGEGVACLQQDTYDDGSPLYYRECNFCGSDYDGSCWSNFNCLLKGKENAKDH